MEYLASERTESVGIEKASLADLTSICDTFSGPWLRPFIQKHYPCAVDNVGLNA